ncbi:hypothetical protein OKW49_008030 [Paraburkholderia youngii]|uniref:hypothetical protein n=1 Tax=Paraburkholderia youngii TaxID=2782701 RepID=UPI003D1BF47B
MIYDAYFWPTSCSGRHPVPLVDHHPRPQGRQRRRYFRRNFFFWLTVIAVPIFTEAALALGAVGKDGKALTSLGSFLLEKLLPSTYDVKGEIYLYVGIIALLIGPQALSFVSGLFTGCAKRPKWLSFGYALFMWAIAKGLVIGGAVIFSFTFYVFLIHRDWQIFGGVQLSWETVRESAYFAAVGFTGSLLVLWLGLRTQLLAGLLVKQRHVAAIVELAIKRATKYQREEKSELWPLKFGVDIHSPGLPTPIRATLTWPLVDDEGTRLNVGTLEQKDTKP